MSKIRKFGILRRGPFRFSPPFAVAWSEPEEIDGEVEVIWVSCGAGEGMRSGEYMVVKAKEGCIHHSRSPSLVGLKSE